MCGIFGTVNKPISNIESVRKVLFHRGPDEQDHLTVKDAFLFHFRLSIVDLSGGKQPMSYKNFHLIWNGEIYNHLELREKHNLTCSTSSDTETILHLFDKLGFDMLEEMDGMFAMAIFDEEKETLHLIRDRAGKKPIYYYHSDKEFGFASELNALKEVFKPNIHPENINNFLELGFFYKEETPYQDIKALDGGSILSIKNNEIKIQKWWDIHSFYTKKEKEISFTEALNQVDKLLNQAVKRRVLSSDLEVASFLSGGIDSGLVTAIAAKVNPNLKTFTVAFDGSFDESGLAELVAKKYNTKHTTIRIGFDTLENDIEKIILQYGQPFMDSSAIPSYYVSQEAKKHVTVVLNGDGADELFGGYRRYVPFSKYDFFKEDSSLKPLAKGLNKILPVSHKKKNLYNYFYRLTELASKTAEDVYFSSTYDVKQKDLLITEAKNHNFRKDFKDLSTGKSSGLDKMMELDFIGPLFGDLLVKMDIATMAHSLEGRSPFLCKELLELSPTLPEKLKINGKTTKYILRELAKKYLPDELINQPKRGFEIPLNTWVNNQLKNKIESYLFRNNPFFTTFINKDIFTKIYNRQISISEEKRAKIIYQLFTLEVWYKNNFE
jgi:asparagine synthase (glutamine-hydrolysing)